MTYKEKLQDGRWQRKRLRIFERDNFKCRVCHNQNTISVHHLFYLPDTDPWDYDDEALVTICKKCHNQIHYDLKKLSGIIAFKILSKQIDITALGLRIDTDKNSMIWP